MALSDKGGSADNMHILLAKYLSRETDVHETSIITAWIEQDEANKKYLEQLEWIWSESKKLGHKKKPDVQKALEDLRIRIKSKTKNTFFKRGWLQVAATFLLIAGMATILRLPDHSDTKPPALLKFSADKTLRSDTLPDGSVVQLQPHSELIYPARFAAKQRSVELKGNAYFSVMHDSSRPFQIAVNDIKVTVLGTSFKIADSSGNTEVVVISGVVQVTRDGRSIKVFPHEKLVVPALGNLWIKQTDTLSNNRLPEKAVQKISHNTPAQNRADSTVDDYFYHRRIMASILDDVVNEGLIADRKHIIWAALTDSILMVNDQAEPGTLQQKLKTKYRVEHEGGYYYGPVKITGKGYFFDNNDFKK